jgi:GMP synthase-like glutamine amidotransferase
MKLGILSAISPKDSVVNWGGTPIEAYIRFFQSVNAPFSYAGYQAALGELPASPTECQAYVITGSPKGVYDDEAWIANLMQFIQASYQAGVKLVGICFGHQILAHALGGHAEKSAKGQNFGLNQFDILATKPWMTGQPQNCALYFAHQDQVMTLPPQAQRLAGNDFCPIAMYEIENQVLGIQGHPEFSRQIMQDLLTQVQPHVTPAQYQKFVHSMDTGQPDNQTVAQWVVNFLTQEGDKTPAT